jgi:hypothetical protein
MGWVIAAASLAAGAAADVSAAGASIADVVEAAEDSAAGASAAGASAGGASAGGAPAGGASAAGGAAPGGGPPAPSSGGAGTKLNRRQVSLELHTKTLQIKTRIVFQTYAAAAKANLPAAPPTTAVPSTLALLCWLSFVYSANCVAFDGLIIMT